MKKLISFVVIAVVVFGGTAWAQSGLNLPGSGAASGVLQEGNGNIRAPRSPRTPDSARPAAQPDPALEAAPAQIPATTPAATLDPAAGERDDAAPASDNLPKTGLPLAGLSLLGVGLAAVGGAIREISRLFRSYAKK